MQRNEARLKASPAELSPSLVLRHGVEATTSCVLCIHVVLRPNKVSKIKIAFVSFDCQLCMEINGIFNWINHILNQTHKVNPL